VEPTDNAVRIETSPTVAERYGESAVGNCLQNVWANAGYENIFDAYSGNGIVEFSTGTRADPTGNYAADTVIDLRVYTNRTVIGVVSAGADQPAKPSNSALEHWGCPPFKDNETRNSAAPQTLDWTCTISQPYTYPDGTTAGVPALAQLQATNSGGSPQPVTSVTVGFSGYSQTQYGNNGGVPEVTSGESTSIPAGATGQVGTIRVVPEIDNGPTSCQVLKWAP
jgi:hypothetical protein